MQISRAGGGARTWKLASIPPDKRMKEGHHMRRSLFASFARPGTAPLRKRSSKAPAHRLRRGARVAKEASARKMARTRKRQAAH
jgi:hypothetical protein